MDNPESYDTELLNLDTLNQNLNQYLFFELYTLALDKLHVAFENFKDSLNYQILKEDIRRNEKLYEILIEGKFIVNV
jgi:hypothetical protein